MSAGGEGSLPHFRQMNRKPMIAPSPSTGAAMLPTLRSVR
jgi:hypothetical protein